MGKSENLNSERKPDLNLERHRQAARPAKETPKPEKAKDPVANSAWYLIKNTVLEWKEDNALRLGAALSFYTIFSLAPLLMIVIGIASLVFGGTVAHDRIMKQIEGLLGSQGAAAI